MEFLADNWYVILIAVAAVAVIIYLIVRFLKLPRSTQISKVKEWLLFAVTEAERELGGGTGQLKLRYVYDMFVSKFPYLVKIVSFEYFSELVDNVLVKFRKILETNTAIKQYVMEEGQARHENEV